MKKIVLVIGSFMILLSCGNDDDTDNQDQEAQVTFSFTHNWDGAQVTSADFNTIRYTNEFGEQLSIERLRYLISDVTFINDIGEEFTVDEYNLIDVTNDTGLRYAPSLTLPQGTYMSMRFTFGFDNEDNVDGAYQDLNSASFNVPFMLGGGYHFMQLDGKYIDDTDAETGFNYHVIRAVDNPGTSPTFPQDTFFDVELGPVTITNDVTIEAKMNIAEWFKNPNTWSLNDLDTVLMPNSMAQIMMYENGRSVFSLGNIIQ